MNLLPTGTLSCAQVAELLAEARARTLLLVRPLSDTDLRVQHSPLMSPIMWDLGHIAHFEEVWLIEGLDDGCGGSEGLRGMYDPFTNPRKTRDKLDLPSRRACLEYMSNLRRAVLTRLHGLPEDSEDRLRRDGFVFRMVLQHEYQHNETILQTLQLKQGDPYPTSPAWSVPAMAESDSSKKPDMVRFPGGEVFIGTDECDSAYDNEKPRHQVTLDPFWMDRTPVTNDAYEAFIEAGGYLNEEFWSEAGNRWRAESGAVAPQYWTRGEAGWETRVMDRTGPIDPTHPVCHVCYFEAEAYARFVGKRLPTEFEWEAAATHDPESVRQRRFPWGDEPVSSAMANLDALSYDTAPVDSYPHNVSPIGCYGLIGDVWEWTSTDFHGYPGYETFPYPEYSEVFFGGGYKVLRGGAWATRTGAIRSTFRNWDYPIRRQIFSGFRCAMDDSQAASREAGSLR